MTPSRFDMPHGLPPQLSRVATLLAITVVLCLRPAGSGSLAAPISRAPDAVAVAIASATAAPWARAGIDSFAVVWRMRVGGLEHVRVQQYWNGLPVLGGELAVAEDAEGRVVSTLGALVPRPDPRGRVALDPVSARAAAVRAGAHADRTDPGTARLAVRPDAGAGHLVWRLEYRGDPMRAIDAVEVDAGSGAVGAIEPAREPAVGLAYGMDPRDSLRERDLAGLVGDGSVLREPWMFALQDDGAHLVRPGGDFRVPPDPAPDRSGFDEVNAFVHAQEFLRGFLGGLGYAGPPDTVHVKVHVPGIGGPAFTVDNYVFLGDGVAGFSLDAAKATDVIAHEVMHTVTNGYGIHSSGASRETPAFHEAISDYMAAAFTGDPAIGEWVYVSYPQGGTRVDAPAATFQYANFDDVVYGPGGKGSQWANSMILSGALWDLRGAIGASADSLVLEALPFLPSTPDWADLVDGLTAADVAGHSGAHRARIAEVFLARGIRGRGDVPTAVIHGPAWAAAGAPLTLTLETTAAEPWVVRWYTRQASTGGAFVWVGSARSVILRPTGWLDVEARVIDAQDRNVYAFTRVRGVGARVTGPTCLLPNQPALWSANLDTLVAGVRVDWRVREWCGEAPCPGYSTRTFTGTDVSLREPADFALAATVTFPDSTTIRDSIFVAVLPPGVRAVLLDSNFGPPPHTFVARRTGLGTPRVRWYLQGGLSGGAPVGLGEGDTMRVDASPPYRIRVLVTDALGRSAESSLLVRPTGVESTDPPVAARFTLATPARGMVEFVVTLPADVPARIALFDLAGRARGTLWQGIAGRQELRVRRGLAGVSPGLYFARLEWPGGSRIARLCWLP